MLRVSLDNLGSALITRFYKRGDIDDITRAVSLRREALALRPPGHPSHDTSLKNLTTALKTRYASLPVGEGLDEVMNRYRESLLLRQHDYIYNAR